MTLTEQIITIGMVGNDNYTFSAVSFVPSRETCA